MNTEVKLFSEICECENPSEFFNVQETSITFLLDAYGTRENVKCEVIL